LPAGRRNFRAVSSVAAEASKETRHPSALGPARFSTIAVLVCDGV
jgi:hypothetical protein